MGLRRFVINCEVNLYEPRDTSHGTCGCTHVMLMTSVSLWGTPVRLCCTAIHTSMPDCHPLIVLVQVIYTDQRDLQRHLDN